MSDRVLTVIPARLGSTRLPRKVLLKESGRYLIDHVHERVKGARLAGRVVIATDSDEVLAACREFGAEAVMTRADHQSGTDRVAEVARALGASGPGFDLVVNVQGDEPELDPTCVDTLVELMRSSNAEMGTLAEPLDDPVEVAKPQLVKVVLDKHGWALYFSRSPLPSQGFPPGPGEPLCLRHVGIYAYAPAFLQTFCALPPAPLERRERLEQLRALWHGHRIQVGVIPPQGARGIDTPEDYALFLRRASASR